jgi:flagellar FliJ protein
MKKFRFKLETVLKARKSNELDALRQLAEAQKKFQAETENKKMILAQLDQSLDERGRLGQVPTAGSSFHVTQTFILGTQQKVIRADQAIVRATRGVEKALRFYLNARKLSRMIETLRDTAYQEYRKLLNKQEQKDQDDLSIMRRHLIVTQEELE